MSFGGFFDNSPNGGGRVVTDIPYSNMPAAGALSQQRLVSPSLAKSMFSSPGLSLALQTNMEGQGEMGRIGENYDGGLVGRAKEDEYESRSGSGDMDGGSGDDQDAEKPPRKKRYHRHTPQQIQELESLFKECPHPDEKQRMELSRRLSLESRQVKFWFQNRRTQMKTQLERHENSILRQENDKLRAENMSIRDAMRNPICNNCGGPAMLGDVSLEEQHLRIENARLKDELDRVCALAGKFLGRPVSSLGNSMPHQMPHQIPNSSLELGVGSNGFDALSTSRWAEMFPCMIARTSTADVISSGLGSTRNGALQLMHAELQVLSPLVPIREVNFIRFCKQHAEGVWAVVDVSVDTNRESQNSASFVTCRRLPSGCVVQDMPNGYSKVTWVEHAEYDANIIHRLYRPLISSGMGFGAQRWIATLERQCECLAILMSTVPTNDHSAIEPADVRVMTRKSIDDPGEPPGVVLSAATSVWLPVSPQKLFDFLRDERLRSEWDILSNGGPMQEMTHIAKGRDQGNCVSLLRASAMNANQSSMLILQETCIDAAGSLVVYAPVDIPAMHVVMSGGDSAYVALLPSGFAIVPDGPGSGTGPNEPTADSKPNGTTTQISVGGGGGSLLTVAFQILVNSLPTAKLTVESVETVNNLISCTVQKIKAALHCES
ncbi:hypothetical protein IFM89_037368 [Coptis chinensis]|uniref:Uncharacterized protein n=1 Tax=Coptis chinensis TaxID=261450 RepID=A0A835IGY8_9MAGN|nr:hypothetical protein IFM89_037368 [Coptis chinensis]